MKKVYFILVTILMLFTVILHAEEEKTNNTDLLQHLTWWEKLTPEQRRLYLNNTDLQEEDNTDLQLVWWKHWDRDTQLLRIDSTSIDVSLQLLRAKVETNIYNRKGNFAAAEQHYQKLLEEVQNKYPNDYYNMLRVINDFAMFYMKTKQHYKEAEKLYINYPPFIKEIEEPRHTHALDSLKNLATLYKLQGRIEEAETLLNKALKLAPDNKNIESSLEIAILLANLYAEGRRYNKTIKTSEKIIAKAQENFLPDNHPVVIAAYSILGVAYQGLDRNEEAEKVYRKALNLAFIHSDKAATNSDRPISRDMLTISHNLSHLYYSQRNYAQSEQILRKILNSNVELTDKDFMLIFEALCSSLIWQEKFDQAVTYCKDAFTLTKQNLPASHPYILNSQINYAHLLMRDGQLEQALELLKESEANFLERAKFYVYTLEDELMRRELLIELANYQNAVFDLYRKYPHSSDATQLVANAILRWKSLQAEEEATITHFSNESSNSKQYLQERTKQYGLLSHAFHQSNTEIDIAALNRDIEAKEREFARQSPSYQKSLQVTRAHLKDVQYKLPNSSILIEFRQHRPFGNSPVTTLPEQWFILVISKEHIHVKQIGEIDKTRLLWQKLQETQACWEQDDCNQQADQYAAMLYQNLFGEFDELLSSFETVYIAPDSFLSLIPFSRLKLPSGQYWIERQTLIQLQSGRDLLRENSPPPSNQLLAMGGIKYDERGEYPPSGIDSKHRSPNCDARLEINSHDKSNKINEFPPESWNKLEGSDCEVDAIQHLYQQQGETLVLKGTDASETFLKKLEQSPDILHLSTHGFYKSPESKQTEHSPLLLSGIVLAGADSAFSEKTKAKIAQDNSVDDGILYAQEILNLNLRGTRLVVLSACDTAQGVLDYSEGVYGLARAFKIAGAHSLITTLWKINDKYGKEFMVYFYQSLLKQPSFSPAKALRDTQLAFIHRKLENLPYQHYPQFWASYVFVGNQ